MYPPNGDMTDTDTIHTSRPEDRRLLRRYGDHRNLCIKRAYLANPAPWLHGDEPKCDCGWLQVLLISCEADGEEKE